jgi:hypothetical protein
LGTTALPVNSLSLTSLSLWLNCWGPPLSLLTLYHSPLCLSGCTVGDHRSPC